MNLPILEKTLRDLAKKKTVVFVILLQLFLVLSLGMVLANISILFEPKNILIRPLPFGVVDDIQLLNQLRKEDALDITVYSNEELAEEAFFRGEIDAYVTEDTTSLPHIMELVLPTGDIRSSIVVAILKKHMEIEEDILRRTYAPQKHAVHLSSLAIRKFPDISAAKIFEILYGIIIPFFLLMPAILLSSMVIDIVVEDMDKKTISLVLMRITASRYIGELALGVIFFSMVQVVVWMILLALRRVLLTFPLHMLLIVTLCTGIFFLLASVITLLFPNKTKAQLMYSFLLIFLFSSLGLTEYHPLRLITAYALGIPTPSLGVIVPLYLLVIIGLTGLTRVLSSRLLRA